MQARTSASERTAAAAPRPSPAAVEDDRLRHGWHARLRPLDEAERAAVDALAAVALCRRRLGPVEARVLEALAAGAPAPGLPSLSTLCRYRARLEKDRTMAEQELRLLQDSRPRDIPHPELSPERLEWLAEHLRTRRAAAEAAAGAPGPSDRPACAAPARPAGPGPRDPAVRRPPRRPDPLAALGDARARLAAAGLLRSPARPRPDWRASTSTYALAAAQLAAGTT